MHELVINLHMHTTYSDGTGSHASIAEEAVKAGLDAVIVTDHNVWVDGPEAYYPKGSRQVLLLVGEEVHDQARDPQKNHMLIIGTGRELAHYAPRPQQLIDQVEQSGGLSFIAHPYDPALPIFNEPDISWVDWQVKGFTGIELWNSFSEFKTVINNKAQAIFYAFFPQYIAHGPQSQTLRKYDELISSGRRIVAIGGSDAHALKMRMGFLRRTIFPYGFHFRGINTHLLASQSLSGNMEKDRSLVLEGLRDGHAFIGYDLFTSARGFRFSAQGRDASVLMGDSISLHSGVTLQIRIPNPAECSLLRNGKILRTWNNRNNITFTASQAGAYRVEVYQRALGKRRGWIFSNPIYILE